MERKVILNSFHSSSANYIEEYHPEIIVSFDSHLDLFLGIGKKSLQVIDELPKEWADCLTRRCFHFFIRPRILESKVFIVIPEMCLLAGLGELLQSGILDIPKATELFGGKNGEIEVEEVVRRQAEIFEEFFGMATYTSPPLRLGELANKVGGESLALDVDADYIREFQNSCYTPAPHFPEGPEVPLNTMREVLKFVERTEPRLITFSEARAGIRDTLLAKLRRLGYEVEEGLLVADEKAVKMVKLCDEFWKSQIPRELPLPDSSDHLLEILEKKDEELAAGLKGFTEKIIRTSGSVE